MIALAVLSVLSIVLLVKDMLPGKKDTQTKKA